MTIITQATNTMQPIMPGITIDRWMRVRNPETLALYRVYQLVGKKKYRNGGEKGRGHEG